MFKFGNRSLHTLSSSIYDPFPWNHSLHWIGLPVLPRQTLWLPVSVPFPLLPPLSICVPFSAPWPFKALGQLHVLLTSTPVAPHQRGTPFYVNVSSYLSACFLPALYILGRQSPVCCVILTHYSLLSSQNVCFRIDGILFVKVICWNGLGASSAIS